MGIQELLNALDGLTALHDELLQLAREKQKHVINNQVNEVMAVTAKETKVISSLEQLNRDVNRLTGECWAELGLAPNPSLTLTDLIQAMHHADLKNALTKAAERVRNQVTQLKELNERNQLLVRQSLDYLQFQIELFTEPYDDITYSPTKSSTAGTPRRTFDTRA